MVQELAPAPDETGALLPKSVTKGSIDFNNLKPISIGELPKLTTKDHVTNSIINTGVKLFLPKTKLYQPTANKYLPVIKLLEQARVIVKTSKRPKYVARLFTVPKSDPTNPRIIIDLSKFTKLLTCPSFNLPKVSDVFRDVTDDDYLIKLDLTNGFFHVRLHEVASSLLGLRCGGQFYRLLRLPQGLSTSPYLMQRVMVNITRCLLGGLGVRSLVYLDDILLIGRRDQLLEALHRFQTSNLLINARKSTLIPTRRLTYLGVVVDLDLHSLALTSRTCNKIKDEIIKVYNRELTLKYKQRISGLINFISDVLRLPKCVNLMPYVEQRDLIYLSLKIHPNFVSHKLCLTYEHIYVDATPTTIAISNFSRKHLVLYSSNKPILHNEYIAIMIANFLYPKSIVFSDNQAAMWLYFKGRVPPNFRDPTLILLLMYMWTPSPLSYVPSDSNPADIPSRWH